MKYRHLLFTLPLLTCVAIPSHGSVNLFFSDFTSQANGFRDQNGVLQNGMEWAIVVYAPENLGGETYNPDFSGLNSLGSFDIYQSGQYLDEARTLWYVFGKDDNEQPFIERTLNYAGNSGSIGSINELDYQNLALGYQFAIIWFPDHSASSGSSYGYLSDSGLTLPNDSGSRFYYDLPVFNGVGNFVASRTIIPEPSAYVLALTAGMLVCCIAYRRKNNRK